MTKMAKRVYVRYFTKDKLSKINPKSIKVYDKYRKAKISKDLSVKESTYKVYQNYFNQFLVFVSENYENQYILDEDLLEEMVDVLEDFIVFCQDTLGNNKKVINAKLSAVSSFYIWAVKRNILESHPFDNKLERMRGAKDEKLISSHFLDDDEIEAITVAISKSVEEGGKFDIQDAIIWNVALDSGCRLGALKRLTVESLDLKTMSFVDIREKRGKIKDVPFNKLSKKYIEQWLSERQEKSIESDGIFIAKYEGEWNAMSSVSIYKRVKKMGHILGIEDFRPHSIRKTTINRIVEKTGNLTLAQDFAGHESPETTAGHYVKKKSNADIRDELNELFNK